VTKRVEGQTCEITDMRFIRARTNQCKRCSVFRCTSLI